MLTMIFVLSATLFRRYGYLSKTAKFPFRGMDYSPMDWTKMADDIDLVCCSCNGLKHLCKDCACVNSGRPCSNCLPDRTGRCHNRFGQSHLPSNESSVPEVVVGSGGAPSPSSSSPVSTLSSPSLDDSVSSSQYQDSDLGSITSDAPSSFQPEATRQTSLPDFVPLTDPNFQWGSMEGASFCSVIESCYNEIMHWRKNIFKVPYDNVGDAFVKELTRLFHSYAASSCLESIALYAAMVMPTLLLQKPPGKVAAKDTSTVASHSGLMVMLSPFSMKVVPYRPDSSLIMTTSPQKTSHAVSPILCF